MGDIVNSISFQENNICWLNAEVNNSQSIVIKRVALSPLPFIINYENIQKSTTALQISTHLTKFAIENGFTLENVRFLLSAKFGIIKKIMVDHHIPETYYPQLVKNELSYSLTSPIEEYFVYQPDYFRDNNSSLKEVLTVSMRKSLFEFIQNIGREASMAVTNVNLNCFSIDELYRRFFPNVIGETLLINFTERGFEMVISDENNFLNFSFHPYSKSLQSIDQLEDNEIISAFSSALSGIQNYGPANNPAFSLSQVFLFGNYFKAAWLDNMQAASGITLKILNPGETTEWQIISEDNNFSSSGFRFVEPLSNIF